jgi:hypothetical protein
MALKHTVFEASNVGVNSSTARAKTSTTARGPEDLRLIISTPQLLHACMLGEGTVLFGALARRGPGRVASNRLESFAQFAGNENFHIHWAPYQLTDELRQVRVAKYGELLRALEAMQRTHHRRIITGDESWFDIEYQHASQWSI